MEFFKAHGTANDFVVLEDLDDELDLPQALVRALCDRRRGIGADGVLRLGRGQDGADVFMDYRNADGSIVEMCGNGVRVVAKHVVDHGLVIPSTDEVVVDTRAGHRPVTFTRDPDGKVATVTVDMGPPSFVAPEIPYRAEDPDAPAEPLPLGGAELTITAVSMGNPHAVTFVDSVEHAPVRSLGPRVETHERFPAGANVEFVEPVARDRLRLRVWERGIGETASCGTGVCAAYAVAHRLGKVDGQGDVDVPGGTLHVRYQPDEHPSVIMTGPAVEVARGVLDPAWLEAVRAGYDDLAPLRLDDTDLREASH